MLCYEPTMEHAVLQFFEDIRCPALTAVFSVWAALGEATVLSVLVVLVYWLAAERTGEQIAITLLSSLPLNVLLKYTVARPRPYAAGVVSRVDIDSFFVSTRDLGDTLSFPSGHAQLATGFLTAAALRIRRAFFYVFAALLLLCVMCSRLYFGVHYPTDLLAGFALGVISALFWEIVYAYAFAARRYILCAVALLSLIPLFFFCPDEYVQAAGLLSGAAVFLPLVDFMGTPKPSPFPRRLLRIPVGLFATGATFALGLLFPAEFLLLRWFLFAGGATFLAELCFRIVGI